MAARLLLRRIAERYASIRTYADRGLVTSDLQLSDGSIRIIKKPFKTAFIRPDRFRFEFTDQSRDGSQSRYIVWQNGSTVRTFWTIGSRIRDEPDLGMAIAGATGVSGGSALTVPELLLPEVMEGAWSLADLQDVHLPNDATIVGLDHRDGTHTITIDPESLLIRRIAHKRAQDRHGALDHLTTYDPFADLDLPAEDLEARFPSPEA